MKKEQTDSLQNNIEVSFEDNILFKSTVINDYSDEFFENLIIKPEIKKESEKKKITPLTDILNVTKKQLTAGILAAVMVITCCVGGFTFMKSDASQKEDERITAAAKNAKKSNISSNLRQYTVKKVKEQKVIPAYSLNQINKMDMSKVPEVTPADLKLITSQNLVGLEESFVKAGKKYHVNPLFLVAIASMESANGTICFKPNNMFGYGSKGYSSKSACIYDVAKGLGTGYLKPGSALYSGKRITDVNKRYAASSTWDTKVANNMYRYYRIIHQRRANALKNL